jgi:hypothetical protein
MVFKVENTQVDERAIFLYYKDEVRDFILNSTTEDTYQLSVEVLPGAFEFGSEVQNYSGTHRLEHLGMSVFDLLRIIH